MRTYVLCACACIIYMYMQGPGAQAALWGKEEQVEGTYFTFSWVSGGWCSHTFCAVDSLGVQLYFWASWRREAFMIPPPPPPKQSKHQVQGGLFLDIVVGESVVILQPFVNKNQMLQVKQDALLVWEFGFDILRGITALNFRGEGLAHPSSQKICIPASNPRPRPWARRPPPWRESP